MSDKCPEHALRNYACPACEELWQRLRPTETFKLKSRADRLDALCREMIRAIAGEDIGAIPVSNSTLREMVGGWEKRRKEL
jgi:hypothetical protein